MATRNFVPRKDGEGSIGKASKHWGKGYFNKLFSVTPDAESNSIEVATTEWVRGRFWSLLHDTLTHSKMQKKIEWNGYLCMGNVFGGLILQWGHVPASHVHFIEKESWLRFYIPFNIVFPSAYVYCDAHYSWENAQVCSHDFFIGGDNKQIEIDIALNEQVRDVGIDWFALGF